MNAELAANSLLYSCKAEEGQFFMPDQFIESLQIISNYFLNDINNKLCLIFPTKNHFAQWISIPIVLEAIYSDYLRYNSVIVEQYKQFKKGDKLILNNRAIVEWAGIKTNIINGCKFEGPSFKTKGTNNYSPAEITLRYSEVMKLQKAPLSRTALSSLKTVKSAFFRRNISKIESLLGIDTFGNKEFINNNVCLISKYKQYDSSIADLMLNKTSISDYFKESKIDENGVIKEKNALLISNNFANLILYLADSHTISKIIIDGFNSVTPRSDFYDIDNEFKLPTILISDLSEIELFGEISNSGFDFYNFTNENLKLSLPQKNSPFHSFLFGTNNSITFNYKCDILNDDILESIFPILHSLKRDDADEKYFNLKIKLIQLFNILSRICYVPGEDEVSILLNMVNEIKLTFLNYQLWLGDSRDPIDKIITHLKEFIILLETNKTQKCSRLNSIIKDNNAFIICPNDSEANSLMKHTNLPNTRIISITDVNDNIIVPNNAKAIVTGWPKTSNLVKLFSSFIFSDITFLFYQFENQYFVSVQRRYGDILNRYKSTINNIGLPITNQSITTGYENIYSIPGQSLSTKGKIDINEYELYLDNSKYSKYTATDKILESCKAKRVNFENNTFFYASETHKFLVVNELSCPTLLNPIIYRKKPEALEISDLIAIINTDRNILVEMVKISIPDNLFEKVGYWISLWKELLEKKYAQLGYDFPHLVKALNNAGCKRHIATIRKWIFDEDMIGPENDSDLRAIARMTNSDLLLKNIDTTRKAIRDMTGWRMRAADLVRDKIRAKLLEIRDKSVINSSFDIPDLGRVDILKVSGLKTEFEIIDKRYVNRLINEEYD